MMNFPKQVFFVLFCGTAVATPAFAQIAPPPEPPIAQALRYQRDAAIEREAQAVAHIVEMQARIQALDKQIADAKAATAKEMPPAPKP